MAGSASKVKVTQQADKEAVTEGGAVVGAVEGGKGSQNRGEGSGKGTKRPAEGAADGQAQAASALHLAPNAKRQKTDAEWGRVMLVSSVWLYTVVYILFHISRVHTVLYQHWLCAWYPMQARQQGCCMGMIKPDSSVCTGLSHA